MILEIFDMMKTKLVITGILGVVLSIALLFSIAILVVPTYHTEKIMKYKSNELVKQFKSTYPDSGMVVNSGDLFEQNTSFTYSKNARWASLTFTEGINGEKTIYKCERIISSQQPVKIFYFEEPTPDTIKNNLCGEYD